MSEVEESVQDGVKTITAQLSPSKNVVLRDMNGDELRQVFQITEAGSKTVLFDLALSSMIEINGEKLVPVANLQHLRSRAKRLTKSEMFKLKDLFYEHFEEDVTDPKSETE